MEPEVDSPSRLEGSVSSWPIRLAAVLGLMVAVGMAVLVAWIAPDYGPTSISLRQGLAYGIVFAGPPLGVLLGRAQAWSAVGLGGGMFVAGAATLSGGNLGGLMMLLTGLLLLLVGVASRPSYHTQLIVHFLFSAIVLMIGSYLALDTRPLTGVGVLVASAAVTSTGLWRSDASRYPSAEVPLWYTSAEGRYVTRSSDRCSFLVSLPRRWHVRSPRRLRSR